MQERASKSLFIIDSGIDYTHPDLDNNYYGGIDIRNNDNDPMDTYGHGTWCAGIIAAEDNNIGVIGVAPKARLYAVKVLNDTYDLTDTRLAAGIQWSIDNGMQVISMSLGLGYSDSTLVHSKCDAAYNAGILLVAAAGNNNGYGATYPAAYDSVIAVSATNNQDQRWVVYDNYGFPTAGSNYGLQIEVAAPGADIKSTHLNHGYETHSGTSGAAPHVAGVAALVRKKFPSLSNVNVRGILQRTAEDLGTAGRDDTYGFGLVDAEAAVTGGGTSVAFNTYGNVQEMYAVGLDGNLYNKYWTGSSWSSWSSYSQAGGGFVSGPSVAFDTTGNVQEMYAVGADGNLYNKYWTGSSWSSWSSYGYAGNGFTGSPSVAFIRSDGNVQSMFAVSSNGNLYGKVWTGSAWSGWGSLGCPSGVSLVGGRGCSIAFDSNGGMKEVYAVGSNGNLYSRPYNGDGTWGNWSSSWGQAGGGFA